MKPGQHVVPHGDEWALRREGADRVTAIFDTQAQAIDAGRQVAENQAAELFIHGRDGRIRDRDSYGNDPNPPKDQKH